MGNGNTVCVFQVAYLAMFDIKVGWLTEKVSSKEVSVTHSKGGRP